MSHCSRRSATCWRSSTVARPLRSRDAAAPAPVARRPWTIPARQRTPRPAHPSWCRGACRRTPRRAACVAPTRSRLTACPRSCAQPGILERLLGGLVGGLVRGRLARRARAGHVARGDDVLAELLGQRL